MIEESEDESEFSEAVEEDDDDYDSEQASDEDESVGQDWDAMERDAYEEDRKAAIRR